jgi:hypothetical protein
MTNSDPFIPNTEGVWLDLDAETYHKAPGVSQSRLKEFDAYASPRHYRARKPRAATPDMEFGTICHTALLEPLNLPRAYHVRPDEYPAEGKGGSILKPWHGQSTWCKNWLESHSDRPIITAEREACIERIVERVNALPEFGAALAHGQREVSYFKRDPVTGLLCKCRCDVLATDNEGVTWVFDLKKVQTGEGRRTAFQRQVMDRGYHVQAASYLHITGASRFVFVPFDDDEPFDAIQWEPDAEMLSLGLMEYRRMLDAFSRAIPNDFQDGYAGGIHQLGLPNWARRQMNQEWL